MNERMCKLCQQSAIKWSTKDTCKKCYGQQWHKNHPDKKGPERHYKTDLRFKYSIRSAKARNIVWSILLPEFENLIDRPCHYCQNSLGKHKHGGSGLDRIDNSQGYIINICTSLL